MHAGVVAVFVICFFLVDWNIFLTCKVTSKSNFLDLTQVDNGHLCFCSPHWLIFFFNFCVCLCACVYYPASILIIFIARHINLMILVVFPEPMPPAATSGSQFTSQPKYLPSTCKIRLEHLSKPVTRGRSIIHPVQTNTPCNTMEEDASQPHIPESDLLLTN